MRLLWFLGFVVWNILTCWKFYYQSPLKEFFSLRRRTYQKLLYQVRRKMALMWFLMMLALSCTSNSHTSCTTEIAITKKKKKNPLDRRIKQRIWPNNCQVLILFIIEWLALHCEVLFCSFLCGILVLWLSVVSSLSYSPHLSSSNYIGLNFQSLWYVGKNKRKRKFILIFIGCTLKSVLQVLT